MVVTEPGRCRRSVTTFSRRDKKIKRKCALYSNKDLGDRAFGVRTGNGGQLLSDCFRRTNVGCSDPDVIHTVTETCRLMRIPCSAAMKQIPRTCNKRGVIACRYGKSLMYNNVRESHAVCPFPLNVDAGLRGLIRSRSMGRITRQYYSGLDNMDYISDMGTDGLIR
jgi:hypothetical protein